MGTNSKELTPAYAIHPGEFILDEIKANGFSQASFAKHIGMEKSQLNEIIKGKRSVNPEFALLLETALGLEAIYWLNLQSQFDIDKCKINKKVELQLEAMKIWKTVSNHVPFSYLKKQNVLIGDPLVDIPTIENIYGVPTILQIPSVINSPQFTRFRKSERLNVDKINLIGWVKYSEHIAKSVEVKRFNDQNWQSLKKELRSIIYENEQVHKRSKELLSKYGIKLLYQEKAEKAPIDGIAFWSGENPTIAMTLRHKRLDNFAFTLFHELGHVFLHLKEDKTKEIIDLFGNEEEFKTSKEEVEANDFATESLISTIEWNRFMSNDSITDEKVYNFAAEIKMNPSVILGRFCFETNTYNISTNISHNIN